MLYEMLYSCFENHFITKHNLLNVLHVIYDGIYSFKFSM